MTDFLKGVRVGLRDGSEVDAGEHTKGKVVLLYFSAMWCPSCRQFTPKLVRFFEAVRAAGRPLEVVLVSRDREADHLKEYFLEHNGDWTHLQFGDPKIQEYLAHFEVPTIPAARVLYDDGTVLEADARNKIVAASEDPVALFDEWKAKHDQGKQPQ